MMRLQRTAVAAVRCSTQTAKSSALILPTLTDSLVAASVFQSSLSVHCCRRLTSAESYSCIQQPNCCGHDSQERYLAKKRYLYRWGQELQKTGEGSPTIRRGSTVHHGDFGPSRVRTDLRTNHNPSLAATSRTV